jgi:hypothetical protein
MTEQMSRYSDVSDANVPVGVSNRWRSVPAGRAAISSPGTVTGLHCGKDHRPDRLLEVAAAIDRPKAVRPYDLMRGVGSWSQSAW